jgi:hypothetical protein
MFPSALGAAPVKDLGWILVGVAAVVVVMAPLGWLVYLARPRRMGTRTRRAKRNR